MKFLPTILLLLPLLTACNSELDFGGDTPGTKNAAIGFSNNMKITRAEATLTEIQTNGFSVWGGYEGNTVFDGRKVTYDNSNSEWGYEDTEYWTYNTYDFHGVYPTPDANSTDKNYTVTWDNTTKELKIENFDASSGIDLLHAPVVNQNGKLASVTSQPVTMEFNHILTNVNVELIKKQEAQVIEIVKAAILLPTVGDYSWPGTNSIKWSVDEFSTKTLTFDYSSKSKTLSTTQYTPIIENLLCIPQEITANAITLRVDYSFKPVSSAEITENREYYVTLPAGTWNPGDKVVYRGIIDAHMNIVFGAPTVEEWGEDMAGGTIIIK